MEQRRLIPFAIFFVALFMLWSKWVKFNQPPATPSTPAAVPALATSAAVPNDGSVPIPSPDTSLPVPSSNSPAVSSPKSIHTIETDVIRAVVSAEGGNIIKLELLKHRSSENPDNPFIIFDDGKAHIYEAQSGVSGEKLPNHRSLFEFVTPGESSVLQDGQGKIELRMKASVAEGVTVTKILTFTRGSYLIDVAHEIENKSGADVSAQAYFQFLRDGKPIEQVNTGFLSGIFGGIFSGAQTFTGPAFYTEANKFQKVSFDDISNQKVKIPAAADNGWVAMVQHYFVSAWLPPENVNRSYDALKTSQGNYVARVILDKVGVGQGKTERIGSRLYAGPQDQNKLEEMAPGLKLVVDYGKLTVIAAPLFWLLSLLHSLTGNWGWAIILVTVIIKALFFPLSAASYKSMAKMRVLAPRLQRMKEQYGDDKVKMQQEMMKLYREEKINPLGGCLPILVQIPVFLALYWVLLASVEMRQAPWLGWIQDLSAPDPYLVLPIIMGVSMLVQTKLNPSPPDPMQAKIMMAMPIVFTFMFLWFPSGLVLYWVVNNLLSIAQQWQITRMIEKGKGKKLPKAANDSKA
jgi:YidC/Oxa1 family membrane protein insertase